MKFGNKFIMYAYVLLLPVCWPAMGNAAAAPDLAKPINEISFSELKLGERLGGGIECTVYAGTYKGKDVAIKMANEAPRALGGSDAIEKTQSEVPGVKANPRETPSPIMGKGFFVDLPSRGFLPWRSPSAKTPIVDDRTTPVMLPLRTTPVDLQGLDPAGAVSCQYKQPGLVPLCIPEDEDVESTEVDASKRLEYEAEILHEARAYTTNVCELIGKCRVGESTQLVFKKYKGGSLFDYIKNKNDGVPMSLRIKFSLELAQALAVLHEHGIVHRDIKPQNCLIDLDDSTAEPSVVLSDFELAKKVGPDGVSEDSGDVGTLRYLVPAKNQKKSLSLDELKQRDAWAFGCLLGFVFSGEEPYDREGVDGFDRAAFFDAKKAPTFNYVPGTPQAVKDLISGCLKFEPSSRSTARDIVNDLGKIKI